LAEPKSRLASEDSIKTSEIMVKRGPARRPAPGNPLPINL
jgi:hypothetical protein